MPMAARKNAGKGHRGTKATGRDYKYERGQMTSKQKADNARRAKARRDAIKAKRVRRGDGKHVDHIKPLSKGGSNGRSNTRVTTAKANQRKGNRRR